MGLRGSSWHGIVAIITLFSSSELRRPKPAPNVVHFIREQPLERLYIGAVTLAEIRFGIELAPDANKRMELTDWLTNQVRPMFESRILPVTEDVMFKWRMMVEAGKPTPSVAQSTNALCPAKKCPKIAYFLP